MALIRCPNCGMELEQEAKFCTKCGNSIPETPQIVQQRAGLSATAIVSLIVIAIIAVVVVIYMKNKDKPHINTEVNNYEPVESGIAEEDLVGTWEQEALYKELDPYSGDANLKQEGEMILNVKLDGVSKFLAEGHYEDYGYLYLDIGYVDNPYYLKFNVWEEGDWRMEGETILEDVKDRRMDPIDAETEYYINNEFKSIKENFLNDTDTDTLHIKSFNGNTMVIEYNMDDWNKIDVKYKRKN